MADLAPSGEKALSLLARKRYDLIITDMALGSVQGDRILRFWARRLKGRGTQALAITGDILNQAVMDLFKKHGIPYLTKPFDLNALRQKARELLAHPAVPAHG